MCMLDLDRAGCIVRGPRVLMDDDDEWQVLTRDERLSLRLVCCEAWRAEMRCSFFFQLPTLMRGSRMRDELYRKGRGEPLFAAFLVMLET